MKRFSLRAVLFTPLKRGANARGEEVAELGWAWFVGSAVVALGLVILPLQELPLARWLAGFVDHWSVPTLALLASTVSQKFFGIELLRRVDQQAAWSFGAVAGLTLYPLALGLGAFDPYGLGWQFGPLFGAVAILAMILHWRRNRLGVVLLLAAVAWAWRVPESGNYWDCLVDPFYFLVSLCALGSEMWRRWKNQRERATRAQI